MREIISLNIPIWIIVSLLSGKYSWSRLNRRQLAN